MRATLALLTWLCACDGGETAAIRDTGLVDPLALAVDLPGPFNAGFRVLEASYVAADGSTRVIPVNVWYPTEATEGDEVRYSGFFLDPLALGEAPAAAPVHPGGYPLHAHTHGHLGYGATSADLMRWFASHGWVAVAPDHVGNLLFDDDPAPDIHALRARDIIASVDLVAGLDASDPLAATATDSYLLSGHSRGCTTSWALLGATFDPATADAWCAECTPEQIAQYSDGSLVDARVAAAIPMAGTLSTEFYGQTGHRAVDAPVLSMTGTNDGDGQYAQWDLIDEVPFWWLDIEGACHQTFALGTCSTLPTDEGYWIVDTYALAFGRAQLLGDPDPTVQGLLDGSIALDPRALLQSK